MRQVSVACSGLMLLMAAFACGGQETQTIVQTRVIAATGGTVTAGGATLVIPAGALAQDTTITVTISSPRSSLPDSSTVKGSIFDFGPDGTTFSTPATLTLPLDGTPAANERAVISFLDPVANQWVDLRSTVTGTAISAPVSHFTEHASRFMGLIPGLPTRIWTFDEILSNGARRFKSGSTQIFGTLNATIPWGAAVRDQGIFDVDAGRFGPSDGIADGQIYSSEGGGTFVVSTEAANQVDLVPDVAIGNTAILLQSQSFLKTTADASLTFDITHLDIEGIDRNPTQFEYAECPITPCPPLIMGRISLLVTAHTGGVIPQGVCAVDEDCPEGQDCDDNLCFKPHKYIFHAAGVAQVKGDARGWVPFTDHKALSDNALWDLTHFTSLFSSSLGQLTLTEHLQYTLDLSEVDVGEQFTFEISAAATVEDRRMGKDRDSSVYAFLRDPLSIGGTTVTTEGLEPTNDPQPAPPVVHVPAPPCIPGPSPAGVLQFSAATYNLAEWAGDDPEIVVTRTGGSSGAVSATFTTSDGTATTGADYTPVSAIVTFADGDTANWVIPISIVHDLVPEPDKTVTLTLSEPGGCATLGPQSTAVLTILDDDRPPPDPPGDGRLDPSFGTGGKVTTEVGGNLTAMALQPDGKIVMVGGSITDFVLARYDVDGRLDESFGTGGVVHTDIVTDVGREDAARGVAIQPDGKIVVVGYAFVAGRPVGNRFNFALARYDTDGSLDDSFGSGGLVTNVIGQAFAVAIQPADGKIIVVGTVPVGQDFLSNDFTVARFDPNGTLDPSFGLGGLANIDIAGGIDVARNVVLQTNGAIIVSGEVQTVDETAVVRYDPNGNPDMSFGIGGKLLLSGVRVGAGLAVQDDGKVVLVGSVDVVLPTSSTQFALMRLAADGSPDVGFGSDGLVTTDFTSLDDSAEAVALRVDGRIVVAGRSSGRVNPNFAVASYHPDGTLDTGFGDGGKQSIDFFQFTDSAENVALQPDGKVVLGGFARDFTRTDYALARLLP